MGKMISVEELAETLRVSGRTLTRRIERRELQALRVGRQWRIDEDWARQWIGKNTTKLRGDPK